MLNQQLMDDKATLFAFQTAFVGYSPRQIAELMSTKHWWFGTGASTKEWEAHDIKHLLTGWDVFKARAEAIAVLKESNLLMQVLEGGLEQ